MDSSDKPKEYLIKIPVYTSELIEKPQDLFGGVSYHDMVSHIKKRIDEYNSQPNKVTSDKRNKTKKKGIDKVDYFDYQFGDVPALLIQISAHNTNLHDGYLETSTKIPFEKDFKVGSDNNFILLYPIINGIDNSNYEYYWIVLVYEDIEKENGELISTVKLVLKKILGINVANIKLPEVLEELRKMGVVPELQLRLTSISFDDNEVDTKFRTYLTESKVKRQSVDKFRDLPYDTTVDLINEELEKEGHQKVEVKVLWGKKVYNITKEQMNDARNSIKQTAEEIFNETSAITELDLPQIYNRDFIIERLKPVLNNYLTSYVKT